MVRVPAVGGAAAREATQLSSFPLPGRRGALFWIRRETAQTHVGGACRRVVLLSAYKSDGYSADRLKVINGASFLVSVHLSLRLSTISAVSTLAPTTVDAARVVGNDEWSTDGFDGVLMGEEEKLFGARVHAVAHDMRIMRGQKYLLPVTVGSAIRSTSHTTKLSAQYR